VTLAWHQQTSGDIYVASKPNWYLFENPTALASMHGSPWSYDTNVPLAMYGPTWIGPGKYGDSEVVDLARTVAFILSAGTVHGRKPLARAFGDDCLRHLSRSPPAACSSSIAPQPRHTAQPVGQSFHGRLHAMP
jgi:hypothetical protein